ncbi:hypothetical protein Tco_0830070 [Tanacetum coccineum]
MSTLTFPSTHNMVTFLEKPTESDRFHEIIDFLNANQIHYSLTVNPTIYTSCIEQFWATAKVKTVNGEHQIQALVDKKKVIITETSIRSDLHLEDADGTDCLPTATIFEELERMGYEKPSQKLTFYKAFFSPQWKFLIHTILQYLGAKSTSCNEFSSTMASAIICLATNQKFNLSKYIFDAIVKHLEEGKKQSRRKQTKNIEVPHTSDSTADVPNNEHVPTHSNDPLLSGEDRMKLTELMDMCTKLSDRVLDLEHTKTAQAQEITNLKLRVKKLEKKVGSRTHNFKRLYKVGVTRIVEYSDDESLGAQEDASNQGRIIEDINKDAEVSLVDETQGRSDDAEMFDTNALIDELIEEERLARKKEEEANLALIESWDNTQAMMEAYFELAQRLQAEEQGEITIEERSRLSKEKSNVYLSKNMGGYKYNQLKSKSYDEIQKLFDNEMKRVNTFIPMNSEVMKSKEGTEESSKRIEDELESDKSKKA